MYLAYGKLFNLEPGPPEPVPLAEESSLRRKVYPGLEGYDKLLLERSLMSDMDMPCTILRIPPVYGPRALMHRLFFYLKRMDDGRPVILIDKKLSNWRWTHGYVENIAAALALAATDERAGGRIYNLGEAESVSMIEWVRKIGQAAGWNGEIVTVLDNPVADFTPFTAIKINPEQHITLDSNLIRNELGYKEHIPADEALMRTINWERSHPLPSYYIDPGHFDYAGEDSILIKLGLRSRGILH